MVCPAFGCAWPIAYFNPALAGTITEDDSLLLTSTNQGGMVFTLTATDTGTSWVNGTYTLTGGGITDQGTVTGTWYPPLHGTYAGTVLSSNTGQSIGITTTLNQNTAPDAKGIMPVNGSATITGESCFTTATMASPDDGFFYGNYLGVSLVATNNPSIYIYEFGILSQDGKTIQFTYSVVDINGGKVCDNNDLTRATLTLQ